MTLEEYTSARATPELIGRKDILQELHKAVDEPSPVPHVFYITSPGGWGKTRLVEAVLKKMKVGESMGEWASRKILSASRLIDLYHTYTHSDEGLIADIAEVLDDKKNHFSNYKKEHANLDRVIYDFSQASEVVQRQRIGMKNAFIQDFNDLGNHYEKIILAFDTVENLMYETDKVQNALKLTDESIGVAGWLVKDFLPKISNTVVLIAGRPESPQLERELDRLTENGSINLSRVELETFSEEETLEYFNAIIQVAKNENAQIAQRLENIPLENRKVVHYLSDGQPFLLSLFVDYLAVADIFLPQVHLSLDEIKNLVAAERGLEQERSEFRDAILQGFQSLRRPFDRVIRALSWTTKGMGAELLAWMLKLNEPTDDEIQQAKKYIETLRDPQLRLSFVKIRDTDNLVFLQDEMYSLMRPLRQSDRLKANARQTYELIARFYKEKIKDQRRVVENLQKSVSTLMSFGTPKELSGTQEGNPLVDQSDLRMAQARLHSYQVEYVYYSLQADYTTGLQIYSEVAEEAFQSNDHDLWLLLRDELLQFAKPLRVNVQDEEALRYIDSDLGVRWIKINIADGKYERALTQIQDFRASCPELLIEGSFADLNLKVWKCWALTHYGADYKSAKEVLLDVLQHSGDFSDRFTPFFDEWRQTLLKAYAQNIIGYLYRSEGNFAKAVDYFRLNLPLWRNLNMAAEHANTLNNMSWALAELGDFDAALNHCEDALNLRRRLGHRYLIALSLNTLGLIETRNRQPERGRFRCEQALGIFRDLEQPRGIGLASHAFAESLRRMTNVPDLLTDEEAQKNLKKAEIHAEEAVNVFAKTIKEPMRLCEAYIELGCVYREMIRRTKTQATRQKLISLSKDAFLSAQTHAGNTFFYRGYDALVNLAWMYYYVKDFIEARKVLGRVLQMIDRRYLYTSHRAPQDFPELVPWVWVPLGKSYLLSGKMAFDEYVQKNQQGDLAGVKKKLIEAAQEWTIATAYNEKYRKEFRDFVEARKEIYRCLGLLNTNEMEWIIEGIHKIYNEFPNCNELESFESWVNAKFGFSI